MYCACLQAYPVDRRILRVVWQKRRGAPGIEPGTSRTLSGNHTTRPITLDVLALVALRPIRQSRQHPARAQILSRTRRERNAVVHTNQTDRQADAKFTNYLNFNYDHIQSEKGEHASNRGCKKQKLRQFMHQRAN